MKRALVRDFKNLGLEFLRHNNLDHDPSLEAVDPSFAALTLRAILRVHLAMADFDADPAQCQTLAGRIHAKYHVGAAPKPADWNS